MNKNEETSKGSYLASTKADIVKCYKPFHNSLVGELTRYFTVLLDDNQEFIGCGIFLVYIYDSRCSHFIVSAGHVISEIVKKENIKIPINYEINNNSDDEKQGLVIRYPIKDNYYIDEQYDIGIVHGDFGCEKEGFKYYQLEAKSEFQNKENQDILIYGIPWNRYRKATKKFYLNQSENCVVNALQLPSKIMKLETDFFYIDYPNQLFYLSSQSGEIKYDIPKEGNAPDPHGLSGSTIWDYNSSVPKPIGIIIERCDKTIKCINYQQVKEVINKYLKNFTNSNT